ncbi:hypothetical protein AFB00_06600 [Pseudonocardia sp. HH130630-07]|nr:hypothetical protein AFB00_06600 [Pseudonocardia sp. HH130630-07]
MIRPVLGIPPVAAIGLAVGTTALGVAVDLLRIGTVGVIFEIGYLVGCLVAVCWVRRRGIFLPAVQPPLLLAVVVPLLALLVGAPSGGGTAQSVLMAGAPLINAFPAMAVTTGAVLLVAALRLWRQRLGPGDAMGRLRVRLGRDPGGHEPDGPRRGSRGSTARPTGTESSRGRGPEPAGGRTGASGARTGGPEPRRGARGPDAPGRSRSGRAGDGSERSGGASRSGGLPPGVRGPAEPRGGRAGSSPRDPSSRSRRRSP